MVIETQFYSKEIEKRVFIAFITVFCAHIACFAISRLAPPVMTDFPIHLPHQRDKLRYQVDFLYKDSSGMHSDYYLVVYYKGQPGEEILVTPYLNLTLKQNGKSTPENPDVSTLTLPISTEFSDFIFFQINQSIQSMECHGVIELSAGDSSLLSLAIHQKNIKRVHYQEGIGWFFTLVLSGAFIVQLRQSFKNEAMRNGNVLYTFGLLMLAVSSIPFGELSMTKDLPKCLRPCAFLPWERSVFFALSVVFEMEYLIQSWSLSPKLIHVFWPVLVVTYFLFYKRSAFVDNPLFGTKYENLFPIYNAVTLIFWGLLPFFFVGFVAAFNKIVERNVMFLFLMIEVPVLIFAKDNAHVFPVDIYGIDFKLRILIPMATIALMELRSIRYKANER